jgi:eukaryotic-like serine/threonine-protein kinase
MARFIDTTGRPGPSTWEAGSHAEGTEDHPVAGVSWYEAAAYAAFSGKQLPTVYHWVRAAMPDENAHLIPGSNFGTGGALAVGRSNAVNRYGAADMAGNVRDD